MLGEAPSTGSIGGSNRQNKHIKVADAERTEAGGTARIPRCRMHIQVRAGLQPRPAQERKKGKKAEAWRGVARHGKGKKAGP